MPRRRERARASTRVGRAGSSRARAPGRSTSQQPHRGRRADRASRGRAAPAPIPASARRARIRPRCRTPFGSPTAVVITGSDHGRISSRSTTTSASRSGSRRHADARAVGRRACSPSSPSSTGVGEVVLEVPARSGPGRSRSTPTAARPRRPGRSRAPDAGLEHAAEEHALGRSARRGRPHHLEAGAADPPTLAGLRLTTGAAPRAGRDPDVVGRARSTRPARPHGREAPGQLGVADQVTGGQRLLEVTRRRLEQRARSRTRWSASARGVAAVGVDVRRAARARSGARGTSRLEIRSPGRSSA